MPPQATQPTTSTTSWRTPSTIPWSRFSEETTLFLRVVGPLLIAGYTPQEIARRLRLSPLYVNGMIARIQAQLQRSAGEEASDYPGLGAN